MVGAVPVGLGPNGARSVPDGLGGAVALRRALRRSESPTCCTWLTGWLVYPPLLFFATCVLSKRLHDRGRSGWWAALVLLSLVAVWPTPKHFLDFLFAGVVVWAIVELGVMPGEQGANRYGPNPLKPASIV
jgi:uncharacterized membrane protein YhaH (DUF805 family)